MITSFYLIVEAESLETRINGPALGNIRLVINDCEFPTANWNDFVVIVLGWWGASLLSLLNNDSTRETVRFMDGQYAVELQIGGSNMLRCKIVDPVPQNKEISFGEAPIALFTLGFISQSRDVLDRCKLKHWWSRDADNLTTLIELLEQKIAR